MQAIIDADILRYEVGYAAEAGWKGEGIPPFDYVAEILDSRINNICVMVRATKPPILYLTGKDNFRNKIATTKKYKDRVGKKPFHFYNITAYIKGRYDYRLTEGLEADDLLAIEQTRVNNLLKTDKNITPTIICSRDKDLHQVEGWSYGWELGNQPQFGPLLIEGFGEISLSVDRKKIIGYGDKFFYSQLLTGDVVDNIPGLDKCGPVKAFEILSDTSTPKESLNAVYRAYKASYGMLAYQKMLEQGRLLYMTRYLREDGSPILWGQTR